MGGGYCTLETEGFDILLRENFNAYEEELTESEFPEAAVLLYLKILPIAIDDPDIEKDIAEKLPGIVFLRRELD